MLLNKINLNHLRYFEEVYKTRSMTEAARNLNLTQSGVSQHIRSLEESLGLKLFDRINQRLVPSAKAQELYDSIANGMKTLEEGLRSATGKQEELEGWIELGTPIEFGNNILIPLLTKFSKIHPKVKFQLYFDFASNLNRMLLDGSIDFAFVDDYNMDKYILTEQVYEEELDLCVHNKLLNNQTPKHNRKFYETLDYVDYQTEEPVLRMWFEHHLDARNIDLNIKAHIMDVQAISRFITSGMAAGILPHHLATRLIQEGHDLHIFKGSGKALANHISIASVEDRSHSIRASNLMNWLKSELKNNPVKGKD